MKIEENSQKKKLRNGREKGKKREANKGERGLQTKWKKAAN